MFDKDISTLSNDDITRLLEEFPASQPSLLSFGDLAPFPHTPQADGKDWTGDDFLFPTSYGLPMFSPSASSSSATSSALSPTATSLDSSPRFLAFERAAPALTGQTVISLASVEGRPHPLAQSDEDDADVDDDEDTTTMSWEESAQQQQWIDEVARTTTEGGAANGLQGPHEDQTSAMLSSSGTPITDHSFSSCSPGSTTGGSSTFDEADAHGFDGKIDDLPSNEKKSANGVARGVRGSEGGRGANGNKRRVTRGTGRKASNGNREDGSGEDDKDANKRKRTKTGCIGCRLKRVKCDESQPACRRCLNASRACIYPDEGQVISRKAGFEPYQLAQQRTSTDSTEVQGEPSAAKAKPTTKKGAKRSERGVGKNNKGHGQITQETSDQARRPSIPSSSSSSPSNPASPLLSPDVSVAPKPLPDDLTTGLSSCFSTVTSPRPASASLFAEFDFSISPPAASTSAPASSGSYMHLFAQAPPLTRPMSTFSLSQATSTVSNLIFAGPSPTAAYPPAVASASALSVTSPSSVISSPPHCTAPLPVPSGGAFQSYFDAAMPPPPPLVNRRSEPLPAPTRYKSPEASSVNPSFLAPYYPSAEERGLILHFIQHSTSLLSALSSATTSAVLNPTRDPHASRAPPTPSALLAHLLPMTLSFSAQAAALRLALLGISATHQAFLLSQGIATGSGVVGTREMLGKALELAVGLRGKARIAVEGGAEGGSLEVVACLGIMDVMLGGHAWRGATDVGKRIIAERGGPTAMLAAEVELSAVTGVGRSIGPSGTRLMLEVLAFHDVVGSLVSGEQSTLAVEGDWWTSPAPTESTEIHFGVSRRTFLLFARACNLVSRHGRSSTFQTNTFGHLFSSAFQQEDDSNQVIAMELIINQASTLIEEVDVEMSRTAKQGNLTQRVKSGNLCYLNATALLLLRTISSSPRSSPTVQSAALAILNNVSTAIASSEPLHLLWPLILAATQLDAPARPWAVSILKGLRAAGGGIDGSGHGAGGVGFSIDSGEKIIREVWNRLDQGFDCTWRDAVASLDMKVLLT